MKPETRLLSTVTLWAFLLPAGASAAATVTCSQGLQINWSGGQPSSFVQINGQSLTGTSGIYATFSCYVPQSAGAFTVPPYVLNAMPAGTGYVEVENSLADTTFSVSGVEYPYSTGGNAIQVKSTFQ